MRGLVLATYDGCGRLGLARDLGRLRGLVILMALAIYEVIERHEGSRFVMVGVCRITKNKPGLKGRSGVGTFNVWMKIRTRLGMKFRGSRRWRF